MSLNIREHFISFPPNSPEDPRNWPSWRKWLIVGCLVLMDLSVSWGASGFSPASGLFQQEFGVSTEVATLGLSLYVLGLALGPMTLAPLSEYYGRSPIYITSYFLFLLFTLGTALIQNLGGFLVLRILAGIFSSVTIANFGGTIADLWEPHDTGVPMSTFLWAATIGSPSGYFLFSFVAEYEGLRKVFWAMLGIDGGFWVIMCFCLKETRHSVLLSRFAAQERKRTGDGRVGVPEDMKQRGPKELASVALTRPFRFLFTEAIIIAMALYNGYLYGLSFLFNTAFGLVFGPTGHGFSTIGVGLSFFGIMVGITIGPVTNLLQERYYHRRVREMGGANIPEARLGQMRWAGLGLPVSLFWFAWTSYKEVHWIVPILALVLWGWSFYTIILATYTYVEDSYKVYSASALAGLGLVRNVAGAGFPLFATHMYNTLGYEWASSLLGFLSLLLVPIPFVLFRHGPALRKRSPWVAQHVDDVGEDEGIRSGSEKTAEL
ncbi:MFS multidrug transporter-like protein [Athelia psychrophila]|uniref:MFS multidrug transporter-like protein n=1 Tax=Athelia psychrophila TaxID=1759441 RepID=A0A166V9Z1_9AGAM|nr:MFS multidrug transporter-like protein [Fibularhizoctonia sp. CBS 109695]